MILFSYTSQVNGAFRPFFMALSARLNNLRHLQRTCPVITKWTRTSHRHFALKSASKYPFAAREGLSQQLSHGAPCDFVCCETSIEELQSPALLINLDVVEQNCRSMESAAAKHGLNLRAHVKTHKCLDIAEMQVRDQTDKRIEVSTIPELYYFANRGCNDVLSV